ncbi:DsbA family protein [Rickettsiales endosymbiont of Peranema trichophorum]|uniref:thioredoxin domain-containing protein n=1 Tax=Rickettsiales endosymbiont of Peranema trichophorum TaxID=2486577 RepID=UPI00102367F1|nr:thioredoxin domain-containing protein [Rickettsiales endosymbiont of Peranema trichophorum]RZI45583.1 DsbA family protein [Rickettsiales endosymbiont of Peranema trichophorum]
MIKQYICVAVLSLVTCYFPLEVCATTTIKSVVPESIKPSILSVRPDDIALGKPDAKVVVFHYFSLTCPHCADFHFDVLPQIQKNFIDTGKVYYVLRCLPSTQSSRLATLLVNCISDKRFEVISGLLESQSLWAFSKDYTKQLEHFGQLAGLSHEDYEQCMNNKTLETSIMNEAYVDARALDINSIPTFFINGEKVVGSLPYDVIAKKIEEAELKLQ